MKLSNLKLLATVILLLLTNAFNAQTIITPTLVESGSYNPNPEKIPCISNEERVAIQAEIDSNIQMLKAQGKLFYNEKKPQDVKFSWPIKKATGVAYNQIWGLSNYVDQKRGLTDGTLDYNCGTKTYEGHSGTDIFLWPFSWYAMDHFQAENIAAADGQIIAKGDGQFDRNCAMNNSLWNAIYLQHADGTITWYGHMKKGSLTTKTVGDMVTTGEFLGNTGSSGSSTGPHLHFEVHTSGGIVLDPFQGSCNSLNSTSLWLSQRPYTVPTLNAILTHSAVPQFPACPTQETLNLSDYFVSGAQGVFAVYLSDNDTQKVISLSLKRPNGTFYNWNYYPSVAYSASYYYWQIQVVDKGQWEFRVTYNGLTLVHPFTVGSLDTSENQLKNLTLYPNPTKKSLNIQSEVPIVEVQVLDISGKIISSIKNKAGITQIDTEKLPEGVYILQTKDINKQNKSMKFIKTNNQ